MDNTQTKKQTAVITVVGHDRVGIIAAVSRLLADKNVNINDISQTILQDVFTMIMMVDLSKSQEDIKLLADELEALGKSLEISIRIQHTDIFDAMHRI
ncbi:MAG: hypothetical protein PWP10_2774 [Clostridiales bacterium]|jgi:ACT domain-containing protein|nr:ACT domain-containing protein [Eubacteriales bacterium]MDD3197259.1 ACT domain-containing protein [Eubacteriales bacterium]MDD3502888.1 ACT domain-containing protein [Eubacteriales bacterium]MDD4681837.1 ACT domain-containing protein [Eubacteriales bacterium]MDN5314028.1 hypothetical protein [Clostridiales bacterium]